MPSGLIAVAFGWVMLTTLTHAAEGELSLVRQDATGEAIFQEQCVSCHGVRGKGAQNWQEPNEQGEMPPPPHDSEGHAWKHADGMLYRIVKNGWRDPFNRTPRLTMPGFGQSLNPSEIRAVIDYLKTLWTPEQLRFQAEESQRLPYPPEAR